MPQYRLRCPRCGNETLEILKVAERNLQKCQVVDDGFGQAHRPCRGHLEPQLSRGSFILKGQGWYKDGYQ